MNLNDLQSAVQAYKQALAHATEALTDEAALTAKALYPTYGRCVRERMKVEKGFRFRYGDGLYRVEQPEYTFDGVYAPGAGTESLFSEVARPGQGESVNDPIPYSGNMALEEGKYYSQGGVTYLCTRSTGAAVYNALADLAGIYVEVV